MEWAKLAVALIGHVTWPVTIIALVCLFRGQIRALLDPENVESVEAGPSGVKVSRRKIDEDLSAARTAIESDTPRQGGTTSTAPSEHVERMREIAEIDPPVAVFASAAHFESVLRERLAEMDLLPNGPRGRLANMRNLLEAARRHGLLTPSQTEGAERLNIMRNEIAMNTDALKWMRGRRWSFVRLPGSLKMS